MKKVVFAAVISVTLSAASYASGGAIETLKSAVAPSALENAVLPTPAAVGEKTRAGSAEHKSGGMVRTVEMFPGNTPTGVLMREVDLRLQAGASSSDFRGDGKVYQLISFYSILGGGDPDKLPAVEVFPKAMYSRQAVMAEAFLRAKADAKDVSVEEGPDSFVLTYYFKVLGVDAGSPPAEQGFAGDKGPMSRNISFDGMPKANGDVYFGIVTKPEDCANLAGIRQCDSYSWDYFTKTC